MGVGIDRDFLLDGVSNGFRLIDVDSVPVSTECDNYRSTLLVNKDLVENQIKTEIDNGRYIVTQRKPSVISALGAIPKSNGKIRLINDLSRPE